jgi:hypothetical protein
MTRGIVAALALSLTAACTPAQRAGIPVVSQIDAVGMALSDVLGWCDSHGADKGGLAEALRALQREDYSTAAAQTAVLMRDVGEREHVPRDVVAMLRLVEGALAAQAIQDGMRALSGGGE